MIGLSNSLYQFHVHTEYSEDSDMKLNDLYKELKKNNIKGIAITDHNTVKGAIKFKKLYGKDIDVIVGEEIMTTHGEVIGLYLREEIKKDQSVKSTIKQIKEQGGIVYIPHPYDLKRIKTCINKEILKNNVDDIDIIEVFNGRCVNNKFNDIAGQICNEFNKTPICGSDSHSKYELRFNQVLFYTDIITRQNLINELAKSNHINKKNNISVHHYTKLVRLKKLIKRGNYDEVFNLINRKCKKGLSKIKRKN